MTTLLIVYFFGNVQVQYLGDGHSVGFCAVVGGNGGRQEGVGFVEAHLGVPHFLDVIFLDILSVVSGLGFGLLDGEG